MPAVIFDLDGTLVDSAPDLLRAVNVMLGQLDAPSLDLTTLTSFIGNGVPVLLQRVAAQLDLTTPAPEMLRLFNAEYHDRPVVFTQLYPGVAEALEALSDAGLSMALCTNKPEAPARDILVHFGIAGHFDHVVGGDTLSVRKPDPAPLHHAQALLGGAQSVFVGDSEVDAETAERAALPFALFTGGYRSTPVADLVSTLHFDDFADLPAQILAQLRG